MGIGPYSGGQRADCPRYNRERRTAESRPYGGGLRALSERPYSLPLTSYLVRARGGGQIARATIGNGGRLRAVPTAGDGGQIARTTVEIADG